MNFDKRYSDDWTTVIAPKAHKASRGICCHCHRRPSKQVHHARYQRNGKPFADQEIPEIPGEEIFALCVECHKLEAHSAENWVKSDRNPALLNHNTDEFTYKLILGFELTKHVR